MSLALPLAALSLALLPPAESRAGSKETIESSYSAELKGPTFSILFRFHPVAVLKALDLPGRDAGSLDTLAGQRDRFEAYLSGRFFVLSNKTECTRKPLTSFHYNASLEHVVAAAEFECPGAPEILKIRSNLFLDLDMHHELVGEFRYRHALEHFFFNGNEREATIAVQTLFQPDTPPPTWPKNPDGGRVAFHGPSVAGPSLRFTPTNKTPPPQKFPSFSDTPGHEKEDENAALWLFVLGALALVGTFFGFAYYARRGRKVTGTPSSEVTPKAP